MVTLLNNNNELIWHLYPQEPELRGATKTKSLIIIVNRDAQKSLLIKRHFLVVVRVDTDCVSKQI